VQAKFRGGNPWTVAGVKALLKHGKVRESAAKRLLKPDARYLLVTNAALSGKTQGLRVRRAGAWPKPADMAASFLDLRRTPIPAATSAGCVPGLGIGFSRPPRGSGRCPAGSGTARPHRAVFR
jgi:hypothetical protein